MPSPVPHRVTIPGRGTFTVGLTPGRVPVPTRDPITNPNFNPMQVALGKIADIKKHQARIEEELVAIGLALIELSKPVLYLELKCDSFEQLVEEHLKGIFNINSATQLKTVVEKIPAADLHVLGRAKAWEVCFLSSHASIPMADALETVIEGIHIKDPSLPAAAIHRLALAMGQPDRPNPPKRDAAPNTPETRNARNGATKLQRNLRRAGATDASVRARLIDGSWSYRIDIPVSQATHITVT